MDAGVTELSVMLIAAVAVIAVVVVVALAAVLLVVKVMLPRSRERRKGDGRTDGGE